MSNPRALLTTALGFLRLPPRTPALRALHAWLDSWKGIGHVVVGMERHCYKLSLRSVAAESWVASFHDHVMTAPAGFAAAPTPWGAMQQRRWPR